jgi:hypothetical protein
MRKKGAARNSRGGVGALVPVCGVPQRPTSATHYLLLVFYCCFETENCFLVYIIALFIVTRPVRL